MGRPRGTVVDDATKKARGTYRKEDREREQKRVDLGGEPLSESEPPIPLNEHERALWRMLVKSLHPNTASVADGLALALAAKIGARIYYPQPDDAVLAGELSQYVAILRDFGLTPTARLRLATGNPNAAPKQEDLENLYKSRKGRRQTK